MICSFYFMVDAFDFGIDWNKKRPISSPENLGSFCISLGLGLGAIIIDFFQKLLRKKGRDIRAKGIWAELKLGNNTSYSLFLRPFNSDNKILVEKNVSAIDSIYTIDYNYNIETLIAKAVEYKYPLIGLGKKGGFDGGGKITSSNNSWKRDFVMLIENCEKVFIIPSMNPGTLYELNYIFDRELLWKTIFILPPLRRNVKESQQNSWEEIVEYALSKGIKFPKYNGNGLFFTLGDEGQTIDAKLEIISISRSQFFSLFLQRGFLNN